VFIIITCERRYFDIVSGDISTTQKRCRVHTSDQSGSLQLQALHCMQIEIKKKTINKKVEEW